MLRAKTLLGVGATLVVLIALLYVISRQIVLNEFAALEQQLVMRNLNRVTNILADDENSLQTTITDWSEWDDTYQYMVTRDPEYISSNISNDLYRMYRLNVMIYLDMSGKVVYSGSYDTDDIGGAELLDIVTAAIQQDKTFHAAAIPALDLPVNPPGTGGILQTAKGPVMIAIGPILDSFGQGTPHGALIWGRYLGDQEMARLSTLTNLPVKIVSLGTDGMLPGSNVRLSADAPSAVSAPDSTTSHGYALIPSLSGTPAFAFDVAVQRDVYQRGQSTLTYLVISLAIAGLVIGAVVLVLMDRLVLGRLERLNRVVVQIGQRDDLSIRVSADGNDELANLGRTINTTLDALAHSQSELKALNVDLEARVAARTAELQARQSFLQTVLDTIKEGVIFAGADAIYSVNDVIADMTGYSAADLIGRPYQTLFDDALVASFQRAALARRGEGWLLAKDGSRIDVAVSVASQVEWDGHAGSIYVVRDITEERALQARKDRFLADASHELRNPLTNLVTRLYMLRKQPERLEAHLDLLDETAANMRALVEDLLDATRFNRGSTPLKREVACLQPLIEVVVEQQRPSAEVKNLTLTSRLAQEAIYVSADRKRMTQVLTNLLANAIHYTEPGGTINVELDIDANNPLTYAAIRVRDTGIGIRREDIPQLFVPFFRVNQDTPGTGLGLAIVKEIVDQHDGEIAVESEIGQGTTFTVYLATAVAPEDAPVAK